MDLSQLTGHIWLDGEMVPWQEARVHVLTHTFHYGLGVFEGVRAYKTSDGTSIFRLKEHTDRLFRSAHILRMDMPFDKETLQRRPARRSQGKWAGRGLHSAHVLSGLGGDGVARR